MDMLRTAERRFSQYIVEERRYDETSNEVRHNRLTMLRSDKPISISGSIEAAELKLLGELIAMAPMILPAALNMEDIIYFVPGYFLWLSLRYQRLLSLNSIQQPVIARNAVTSPIRDACMPKAIL